MRKYVGIVGSGMVGRDPFDTKCWSGSSRNLFMTLQKHGALHRAFGVEAPKLSRALKILKNCHPDKNTWRTCFNLDPGYYDLLTKEIRKSLCADDYSQILLQIGGHYDSPEACNGKIPCFSYHDGNISGMMKSPYFNKALLPQAKKAFEYEKHVYAKLDRIFVMSEYWRNSFINDFGVDENKVINVGFGVNIDIPAAYIKDFSRKEILFIGIDFSRKGGDILVEAFSKLRTKHKDAILHIVGPHSPPSVLNEFPSDGIIFHGFLSKADPSEADKLSQLLQQSTISVLPSLYEPFGNSVLESMINQMPAVVSNNWSFTDFVIPGKTGELITTGNVDELSEAIDYYLSDANIRAQHGANARESIINKYTWDHVACNLSVHLGNKQ